MEGSFQYVAAKDLQDAVWARAPVAAQGAFILQYLLLPAPMMQEVSR
jgi:hypothetical protein